MIDGQQTLFVEDKKARLQWCLNDSARIIREALTEHGSGKDIAAICVLFSGGNDSTVLTHLMRPYAHYAVHINTGIGIEQTREFVRYTCKEWELPLIEKHPPAGSTYRELVLEQGFPGPAMHFKMYQRLKERGLMQVRRDLVADPRNQRIVFLAGRRRSESARRSSIVEHERRGSIIWISPIANWTKSDLNAYREANPEMPRNIVSDVLHMSGECLCGAFAKPGELEEIAYWFPEVAEHIRSLEKEVEAAGHARCRWGWGNSITIEQPSRSGQLCSSCDHRFTLFSENQITTGDDNDSPEHP